MFQLYRDGQFYWWRKPEYPEKGERGLIHNLLLSIFIYFFDIAIKTVFVPQSLIEELSVV